MKSVPDSLEADSGLPTRPDSARSASGVTGLPRRGTLQRSPYPNTPRRPPAHVHACLSGRESGAKMVMELVLGMVDLTLLAHVALVLVVARVVSPDCDAPFGSGGTTATHPRSRCDRLAAHPSSVGSRKKRGRGGAIREIWVV